MIKSVEERFLEKVDKNASNGCWEWTASCFRNGYGQFGFKGKIVSAHRFSYELFKGLIPEGKMVCHTCDNKRCVNPGHLWLGTAKENNDDAIRKGRSARGSNHGLAKLTEEIVIQARIENSRGTPIADLARKYGVTGFVMAAAIRRITWSHVG